MTDVWQPLICDWCGDEVAERVCPYCLCGICEDCYTAYPNHPSHCEMYLEENIRQQLDNFGATFS